MDSPRPGVRALPWREIAILSVLVAAAFGVRLAVGLQLPLDADESVEGLAALRLLHGQLPLMEPDGRYLGALDSYLLAPFLVILGPTLLAIRMGMSFIGAAYVGAMYALGRQVLPSRRGGLLLAGVAAFFPLFAVTFGVRARTYGTLLLIEAVFLILAIRLLWPGGKRRRRDWALVGLVAGVGLWVHPLLAIPIAAGAVALILRAGAIGVGQVRAGLPLAVGAAVVGSSPWLLYNLLTGFGSIRHLYSPLAAYSVPTAIAAWQLLTNALPVFAGGRVDFCGVETVPGWAVDSGLAALTVAVLWLRRGHLARLRRGMLEPSDLVLAIAPLAIAAVTLRWFNGLTCEPRYLMPLAVPLALAAALVLAEAPPGRLLAGAGAAAWIGIATFTTLHTIEAYRDRVFIAGELDRVDVPKAAAILAEHPPEALWAQYWLARPIHFQAGDRFAVGEYNGYVGFRSTQAAALVALHPSWLFLVGDPVAAQLEAECVRRGITFKRSEPVRGLVLYADLSQPLRPEDLGLGGQTLLQADDWAFVALRLPL